MDPMTPEKKRVLKKMRTGAKKPRENIKKKRSLGIQGTKTCTFFFRAELSRSTSTVNVTGQLGHDHERSLGHARAHVSSPDLVTHIAQHDAGLRAPRRLVVTRRCADSAS